MISCCQAKYLFYYDNNEYHSGMPAKAIALSASVGDLLRFRRKRLGYTLREVERLTAAQGNQIPFSTLARIEQGRLDPGLKRLHALLALYGLPIQAAGDVLDLEAISGTVPVRGDSSALMKRGTDAWQRGDVSTAMACYIAMRRKASDEEADRVVRHESILSFAVIAAKLGKHHVARQILDDLVLDRPARPILFRVLIQSASSWQALGSPDFALALLSGAEGLLDAGDARGRGWIRHLRGSIQIDLGTFDEAKESLEAAARVFQRIKRPYDRALALVAIARVEVERANGVAATRLARRAKEFAAANKLSRVVGLASVQLARARILCSRAEEAIAVLTQLLADSIGASDNVIRFYTHFYLSKAYAIVGDPLRAHVEREQAGYFVRFVDQASKEASEVRGHLKAGSSASNP